MKIAILAAMDKELALLLTLMENRKEGKAENLDVTEGRIGEHHVIMAKCGIGKVNAALNTYKIIRAYRPELVINSGVAGGTGMLKIGELLVAGEVAYHDVWCGPGTLPGAADGFDRIMLPSRRVLEIAKHRLGEKEVAYGMIATGDIFISRAEEVERIRKIFPGVEAVDMESAAIAQTCCSEGVEFSIIRVVSDTPGEGENVSQYKDFWMKAPETTFNALRHIIASL